MKKFCLILILSVVLHAGLFQKRKSHAGDMQERGICNEEHWIASNGSEVRIERVEGTEHNLSATMRAAIPSGETTMADQTVFTLHAVSRHSIPGTSIAFLTNN